MAFSTATQEARQFAGRARGWIHNVHRQRSADLAKHQRHLAAKNAAVLRRRRRRRLMMLLLVKIMMLLLLLFVTIASIVSLMVVVVVVGLQMLFFCFG